MGKAKEVIECSLDFKDKNSLYYAKNEKITVIITEKYLFNSYFLNLVLTSCSLTGGAVFVTILLNSNYEVSVLSV